MSRSHGRFGCAALARGAALAAIAAGMAAAAAAATAPAASAPSASAPSASAPASAAPAAEPVLTRAVVRGLFTEDGGRRLYITLKIAPGLQLPFSTITHRVLDRRLVQGLKPGDSVGFTAQRIDGENVVTQLRPLPPCQRFEPCRQPLREPPAAEANALNAPGEAPMAENESPLAAESEPPFAQSKAPAEKGGAARKPIRGWMDAREDGSDTAQGGNR